MAVLIGLLVAFLGSGALFLGGVSLIALVAVVRHWITRCVVSFGLKLSVASLGMIIGLVLLRFAG